MPTHYFPLIWFSIYVVEFHIITLNVKWKGFWWFCDILHFSLKQSSHLWFVDYSKLIAISFIILWVFFYDKNIEIFINFAHIYCGIYIWIFLHLDIHNNSRCILFFTFIVRNIHNMWCGIKSYFLSLHIFGNLQVKK